MDGTMTHTLETHLVLIGMMGAGKTTLGRKLAARLGVSYHDSDEQIRHEEGVSGREVARENGVHWLHRLEAKVLQAQLKRNPPSVISAAASVVDQAENRALLASPSIICWLQVDNELLVSRMLDGNHRRPMPAAELEALAARRGPLFSDVATLSVDGSLPVDTLVEIVLQALSERERS